MCMHNVRGEFADQAPESKAPGGDPKPKTPGPRQGGKPVESVERERGVRAIARPRRQEMHLMPGLGKTFGQVVHGKLHTPDLGQILGGEKKYSHARSDAVHRVVLAPPSFSLWAGSVIFWPAKNPAKRANSACPPRRPGRA